MEKKYQVFVSSTYEDLQEERKEVIQALLELDCIPVGMELFPAADDDQWSFIKTVIDDCDYYVLILGGRYGSCANNGMGYTEMEYRYALDKGKPIISFLHQNPGNIPANKTEQDSENKAKLKEFRKLAQKKMCKYWNTPSELGAVVGRSIVQLKKRSPAIGWVKTDLVPDENTTREILKLRKRVEELEEQLHFAMHAPPEGTESLAQGDDIFKLHFTYKDKDEEYNIIEVYENDIELTWNEIFSLLSPYMIYEESESRLKIILKNYVSVKSEVRNRYGNKFRDYWLDLRDDGFQSIKVQLKALGLIEKSIRKRSLTDRGTYWKLTPYGDHIMTRLKAIKNNEKS